MCIRSMGTNPYGTAQHSLVYKILIVSSEIAVYNKDNYIQVE